jgi:hypothetical protein
VPLAPFSHACSLHAGVRPGPTFNNIKRNCKQLLLCIVTVPFHCVVAHLPLSITLRTSYYRMNSRIIRVRKSSPEVSPISLHLLPPPSLHPSQTQDELLSDEYSDFPPIRVRKSSPEAPIRVPSRHRCYSSAVQKDSKGVSTQPVRITSTSITSTSSIAKHWAWGQEYDCTSCQWH